MVVGPRECSKRSEKEDDTKIVSDTRGDLGARGSQDLGDACWSIIIILHDVKNKLQTSNPVTKD
jgi:hypothetical protein